MRKLLVAMLILAASDDQVRRDWQRDWDICMGHPEPCKQGLCLYEDYRLALDWRQCMRDRGHELK